MAFFVSSHSGEDACKANEAVFLWLFWVLFFPYKK
jgi:hypothetical protein